MILASILSAIFAILSGIVLVRTGSQPTAELAYIFMIISSAALAASALSLTLARDEPKMGRATSAKIAIGIEGVAALAPPVLMALGLAALLFAPLLVFLPMAALLLFPPTRHKAEHAPRYRHV
jgi:hypothetical protein